MNLIHPIVSGRAVGMGHPAIDLLSFRQAVVRALVTAVFLAVLVILFLL